MSSGQFWWGMTTGLVAGAVVGMSVAPSRREMKKTAHKVAKHVNEAVEDLTEAWACDPPIKTAPPRADRGGSCLEPRCFRPGSQPHRHWPAGQQLLRCHPALHGQHLLAGLRRVAQGPPQRRGGSGR